MENEITKTKILRDTNLVAISAIIIFLSVSVIGTLLFQFESSPFRYIAPEDLQTFLLVPSSIISAVPAIIYSSKLNKTSRHVGKKDTVKIAVLAMVISILINVVSRVLILGFEFIAEEFGSTVYVSRPETHTDFGNLVDIIYPALFAPIFEEIIYRHCIQRSLMRYDRRFAIIVSSLIFAMMHGNISQVIFAGMTGLVLATVYDRTESLNAVISIHMANNIYASAYNRIFRNGEENEFVKSVISARSNVFFYIFAAVLLCVLINVLLKFLDKKSDKPAPLNFECVKEYKDGEANIKFRRKTGLYTRYFSMMSTIVLFAFFSVILWLSISPLK